MFDVAIIAGVIFIVYAALIALVMQSMKSAFVILGMLIPYLVVFTVVGYPRPLWTIMNQSVSFSVSGFLLKENEAIYVWGIFEGDKEPISIKLPWSTKEANELELSAGSVALGQGQNIKMLLSGPEGEPKFYATPVEELPPKQNGIP